MTVSFFGLLQTSFWLFLQFNVGLACENAFKNPIEFLQAPEPRVALLDYFKQKGLPVLTKESGRERIPVVLVNAIDVAMLKDYLDNSIGFTTQHQPNWTSDHGFARFGSVLTDADAPGSRSFNEINQTGISWFQIVENTLRRDPQKTKLFYDEQRIEVSYLVTPEQKSKMAYYLTARRAAIFRVGSQFVGAASHLAFPNMFSGGREHCFIYSKSSNLTELLSEARLRVETSGINIEEFMKEKAVKNFLARAKNYILNLKPMFSVEDAAVFNHNLLRNARDEQGPIVKSLENAMPHQLSDGMLLEFVNWLVAYDAVGQYLDLKKELGVSDSYTFQDYLNPKASAVLVFDPESSAYPKFLDGSYTSLGRTGKWSAVGQKPY